MAIKALEDAEAILPRICMVLETEEESASVSLSYLLDVIKDKVKTPDVMICLDSGCCDFDCLWYTSSLKGCVTAVFKVEALSVVIYLLKL